MKYIITFLAFCWGIHIKGQTTLSGRVTSKESGEGIPGATIYLADLKTGITTDANGQYKLVHLPNGKFLVECKIVGYNTTTKTILLEGETKLDLEIEESAVEIQEVTVTGSSQSTELKDNPVPMTIINQNFLFENTSTNLIDNISKEPGINQLSTGAGISKPVIRGLGFNRIVTLNNNLRQEGQQWGDEHGIEIDEFSVDRVEIIKGPGSLMYGSDAIAGVVNFLSPYPLPLGQIRSGILSNYQTNNHLQAYSLYNTGNIKGFNWLVRGSMKQAGNYKNAYDGYVYNSGFKEYDLNGYLGINKSWGYTHLGFSSFNQVIAMTEGERDSSGKFVRLEKVNDTLLLPHVVNSSLLNSYHYDAPKQSVMHNRINSNTRLYFKRSSLNMNFGLQQNTRKEFGNILAPDEEDIHFLLNTFNYDLRYQLPELKGWHTTFGANGMRQTNENKGHEMIIPDYSLFDIGTYLFFKKDLSEKFNLAGGIRFDSRSISTTALYIDTLGNKVKEKNAYSSDKFAGINRRFTAITGSLGGTYKFNKIFSMKLNFARGFRAPNIAEISSNGRHEGTLRYEIGDATLKPETSVQGDIGFILNSGHITSELSLFYNDIQNFIFSSKIESKTGGDSIMDPTDPVPVYKFTQGNAYLYGGEYSIDIHPHPLDWLHIENAFSMVRGVQKDQPDSMTNLPFIPAPKYQGEIRCEFKKLGKTFRNLYVSANINYYFKQDKIYSAYNTETNTPDYGLLNLGLGTYFVNRKDQNLFTLSFTAANILDVAYQNHLSRLKYAPDNLSTGRSGIYNMGRNFSFKLLIPINIKK